MTHRLRFDLTYRPLRMAVLASIGVMLYLVISRHLQANVNRRIEATAEEVLASVRVARMRDGTVYASFSRDLDSFGNADTYVQIIADGHRQNRSRDADMEQLSLPAPENTTIQRVWPARRFGRTLRCAAHACAFSISR